MLKHQSNGFEKNTKIWTVVLSILISPAPLNASDNLDDSHDHIEVVGIPLKNQVIVQKVIYWEAHGYEQQQTLKAMACVNQAVAKVVRNKQELTYQWQLLQHQAQDKVKRASTELEKIEHSHARKSRKNSRKRYMQVLINEMMPACLKEMETNDSIAQTNHPNLSICLLWILKQAWPPQQPTYEETFIFYQTVQDSRIPINLPNNVSLGITHIAHKLLGADGRGDPDLKLNVLSLSCVPASLGYLSHVKSLNLYANNLHYLPDSFRFLHNLETLFLSTNKFVAIPQVLENLCHQKLRCLTLSFNQIKEISPFMIPSLQRLKMLKLDGNPLVDTFEKTDDVRQLLENPDLNLTL